MSNLPKRFITVEKAISGYMAVHYWTNCKDIPGECFHEPYNTGFGRYDTADKAWKEARDWAKCEELPLVNEPDS